MGKHLSAAAPTVQPQQAIPAERRVCPARVACEHCTTLLLYFDVPSRVGMVCSMKIFATASPCIGGACRCLNLLQCMRRSECSPCLWARNQTVCIISATAGCGKLP